MVKEMPERAGCRDARRTMAIKVLALGVAVYSNIGIQPGWLTAPVTSISF
jgi:hypothetical protein